MTQSSRLPSLPATSAGLSGWPHCSTISSSSSQSAELQSARSSSSNIARCLCSRSEAASYSDCASVAVRISAAVASISVTFNFGSVMFIAASVSINSGDSVRRSATCRRQGEPGDLFGPDLRGRQPGAIVVLRDLCRTPPAWRLAFDNLLQQVRSAPPGQAARAAGPSSPAYRRPATRAASRSFAKPGRPRWRHSSRRPGLRLRRAAGGRPPPCSPRAAGPRAPRRGALGHRGARRGRGDARASRCRRAGSELRVRVGDAPVQGARNPPSVPPLLGPRSASVSGKGTETTGPTAGHDSRCPCGRVTSPGWGGLTWPLP